MRWKNLLLLVGCWMVVTIVSGNVAYAQELSPTTFLATGSGQVGTSVVSTLAPIDLTPPPINVASQSGQPLLLIPTLPPGSGLAIPTGGSAQLRVPAKLRQGMKSMYDNGEKVEAELLNTTVNTIKTEVRNNQGELITANVENEQIDDVTIVKVDPPHQFMPGKYRVTMSDSFGVISQQDFLWGVLALNTNKAVYRPLENSLISMAVLDEQGKTVCDAAVTLDIKNTVTGKIDTLSTANGLVKINSVCSGHDYTLQPDYEATYMVGPDSGTYQMTMSAVTKNGSYTITNQFEVAEFNWASIDRDSITRVFPPYTYPMTMSVTMGADFKGEVSETVPLSFVIDQQSEGGVQNYDRIEEQPGLGIKKVIWEVNAKNGDDLILGYTFQTPSISPQFYTVGPLEFVSNNQTVFSENREWQIAVDYVTVAQITQGATTTAATSTVTNSFTPVANRLYLMWTIQTYGTATSTPTVTTTTGLNWVKVANQQFNTTSTKLSNITLFRALKTSGLSTGTNTITWGQSATGLGYIIVEFSGVDTSGTDGSGAVVQYGVGASDSSTAATGLTINLSALSASSNITAGGFANAVNNANSLTAGAGYSGGTGVAFNNPTTSMKVEWKTAYGATAVNMTQSTTSNIGGIAVEIKNAPISISGSCKKYDMTTNCATGETIRYAVNGSLRSTTTTISGGTYVFSSVDQPVPNDVLTAFVSGVGVTARANTVTEYSGSGNISGLNLYEQTLTIGDSGGTVSIGNTDLANYDNSVAGTGTSDVFFNVDVGNTLTTDVRNQFSQYKLYVFPGNLYQPAGNVFTNNVTIGGTYTAGANTLDVSGALTNNGTFNANTGLVNLSGGATTVVSVGTTSMAFNSLSITNPGKVVQFEAGVGSTPVFTIGGTMTVTGVAGTLALVQSDTPGSQWLVNFLNAQSTISYIGIKDSGCAVGSANATIGVGSTNMGNNGTCWIFSSGPTLDQIMRHGEWFSNGVRQPFTF